MMKALRTGSGCYIDVGASDLIAKGEIKLKSGVEVKEVRERSVILTDGSELPAELIVCATGYRPMNAWVAKLVSEDVAERIGPNWGYGSGTKGDPGPWLGELRNNMWKRMAYPALWFHGGNLALSSAYRSRRGWKAFPPRCTDNCGARSATAASEAASVARRRKSIGTHRRVG